MWKYHFILVNKYLSMIARHYRTVEPSIVGSTEKTLADTLRCSPNRDRWVIRVKSKGSFFGMDARSDGSESDDCCERRQ